MTTNDATKRCGHPIRSGGTCALPATHWPAQLDTATLAQAIHAHNHATNYEQCAEHLRHEVQAAELATAYAEIMAARP